MAKAKETKYLDPKLLIDWGLLQEINRRLLHPRGLALAAAVDPETKTVTGIAGVIDSTNASGGMIFGPGLLDWDKKKNFDTLLDRHAAKREEQLGYAVQPMPPQTKPEKPKLPPK